MDDSLGFAESSHDGGAFVCRVLLCLPEGYAISTQDVFRIAKTYFYFCYCTSKRKCPWGDIPSRLKDVTENLDGYHRMLKVNKNTDDYLKTEFKLTNRKMAKSYFYDGYDLLLKDIAEVVMSHKEIPLKNTGEIIKLVESKNQAQK